MLVLCELKTVAIASVVTADPLVRQVAVSQPPPIYQTLSRVVIDKTERVSHLVSLIIGSHFCALSDSA